MCCRKKKGMGDCVLVKLGVQDKLDVGMNTVAVPCCCCLNEFVILSRNSTGTSFPCFLENVEKTCTNHWKMRLGKGFNQFSCYSEEEDHAIIGPIENHV